MDVDATTLRTRLEQGQTAAMDAVHELATAAVEAPRFSVRISYKLSAAAK